MPLINPGTSPFLGSPGGTIAIATQQTTASSTFLGALTGLAGQLVAPGITPVFPAGGAPPALATTTGPAITDPTWTGPDAPADFMGDLDVPQFPTFSGTAPVFIPGTAPVPSFGVVPAAPGINTLGDIPDVVVNLPAVPNLLTVSISGFGGVTLPTFDAAEPTVDLVAPQMTPYVPGAQYTSALLTALKASLEARITTGGTGLAPAVEEAIWNRARERESKALQDGIFALEQLEALGYAAPPGVWMDAQIKLRTEFGKVEAGLSRDIAIEQAKLELQNVQEALKISTSLEQTLLDNAQKIEQRVFDAARYTTEAAVQIYNSRVAGFATLMQAYQTKAQVFEAKIRGELAKVEVYKATIDAERAKAEINTALVRQYEVQVTAALSAVEIYKARISGLAARADIERTKVLIYGEQVKAHAATINAYTAEVEGYKASMQAEGYKQEAYKNTVDAFRSQVEAVAKQADVAIAQYRGEIDAYTARWGGYQAAAQAAASQMTAIAQGNNSRAAVYAAEAEATASYNEVLVKQWQAVLDQNQRTSEIGVAAAKANADLFISTRGMVLDASKVAAQVAAQLGAAALNALSWSNSYSESYSGNNSYSDSNSVSHNTNVNL